ncbi:MAG TPA: YihY/virulence factor BrkB family protein [Micromonosporaceae bacterium]|jgi:membrane protein
MGHRISAFFAGLRRRHAWFDHLVRAGIRYDQVDGGRLAAAVTYYAFFAVFASALLGFAVLGYVLGRPAVLSAVQNYLAANLPKLNVQALRNSRGAVGLVAFVVLPVAGLFWIDATRSSIRAMWHFEQYPGRFLLRQIIDLGILVALGVLFAASLTVSNGTKALAHWLVLDAGGVDDPAGHWLLNVLGFVLGITVNTLLAIAALTVLPRIHMRARRVVPAALLVAFGLEILNTLGRIYVSRAESNPAYQVVAGAVGLLVFLSLANQLLLFAAALTATSTRGSINDFGTSWRVRDRGTAAPVSSIRRPSVRDLRNRRRHTSSRRPPKRP